MHRVMLDAKHQIIITVVALMLLAGCEEKPTASDTRIWDTIDSMNSTNEAQNNAIREVLTRIETLESFNTPKSNITLMRRVSDLEIDRTLYGGKWLDNMARIDNLEAAEPSIVTSYDPNDTALRYLSKPPAEWTKEHGDSERSLLLYNLSATGVVAKEAMRSVGVVSKCVVKAHPSFVVEKDGNQIMDPNNYVEPMEAITLNDIQMQQLGISLSAELTDSPVTSIADPNEVKE